MFALSRMCGFHPRRVAHEPPVEEPSEAAPEPQDPVDRILRDATVTQLTQDLYELRLQRSITSVTIPALPFDSGSSCCMRAGTSTTHGKVAVKCMKLIDSPMSHRKSPLSPSRNADCKQWDVVVDEARMLQTYTPSAALRLTVHNNTALLVMPAYDASALDLVNAIEQRAGNDVPTLRAWFAVDLLCDVLPTLCNMHNDGFVHCDIKLDNIMRGGGSFELIDFGMARKITPELEVLGTEQYFSPELIASYRSRDCAPTPKESDIWSLGLTALLAALGVAGEALYNRGAAVPPHCVAVPELLGSPPQRLSRASAAAKELLAELPGWLAAAVLPTQMKNPHRRPTAHALLGTLRLLRGRMPAETRSDLHGMYARCKPAGDAMERRLNGTLRQGTAV